MQSRRQDQTGVQDIWKYLTHYRELAIREDDEQFAAVAEQILDRVEADPAAFATSGYSVGEFLAEALGLSRHHRGCCPARAGCRSRYTRVLPGIPAGPHPARRHLGRRLRRHRLAQRREDSAGNPTTIREIASGLSTNPTFFKLRKGAAILDSVRMSPRFFSTGHFRSDGVTGAAVEPLATPGSGAGPVPPAAAAALPAIGRRLRPRL